MPSDSASMNGELQTNAFYKYVYNTPRKTARNSLCLYISTLLRVLAGCKSNSQSSRQKQMQET